MKWQTKFEWTNIGDTRAGYSSFVDGIAKVSDSNTAGKHALFEFPAYAGVGKGISSMIGIVIQRLSSGGSADTYAAPVKLFEADLHYMIDSFGSNQEYIK